MLLKGKDLVPAIKAKQQTEASRLQQAGIQPKLAIIQANDDPVINTYVAMKQQYGADIGVEVDVHKVDQSAVKALVNKLNNDASVHAVIIQLPLPNMDEADELLAMVDPGKDVDGLGPEADYEPATAAAILNLLDGYNIDLEDKQVVIVGRGRLVGAPLRRMLERDRVNVEVVHSQTENPQAVISKGDVVITATGKRDIVSNAAIKPGMVVVDAGTAGEGGKTVGDLAPEIVARDDIKVTPTPGGVGPLTVCALFGNALKAASSKP